MPTRKFKPRIKMETPFLTLIVLLNKFDNYRQSLEFGFSNAKGFLMVTPSQNYCKLVSCLWVIGGDTFSHTCQGQEGMFSNGLVPIHPSTSITRGLYYFSNICAIVTMTMCHHWKFFEEGSTFSQTLSKLSSYYQRLLKCSNFGEISPNMVTLPRVSKQSPGAFLHPS